MSQPTLYDIVVPTLIKHLTALSQSLHKAQEYAESKKLSWANFEEALLQDRLIFDQFPLVQQVQIACDNAKGGVARLAQIEIPKYEDTEKTFDELYARIDKTLAFVQSVAPEKFVGHEESSIVLPYVPDKYLTGSDYAILYLVPNFLFHVTTAYSIMRKNGVPVGKSDYMGELPWHPVA